MFKSSLFFLAMLGWASFAFSQIIITEIHYFPLDADTVSHTELEFIEIKNIGSDTLDLSNISFTKGIDYQFKAGDFIAPDSFLVLASNYVEFYNRYQFNAFDEFQGQLSNSGEEVEISDVALDTVLFSVNYSASPPWPLGPAGNGPSLVAIHQDSLFATQLASNWSVSSLNNGKPGEEDVAADIAPIIITELLTHTDLPQLDAIEIFNPGTDAVDIGGWFLSDNKNMPKKYRIPDSAIINGGEYLVFDESDFNAEPDSEGSFALGAHGGEAFIFSADSAGQLTGYVHGVEFGELENGQSFGRYENSTGEIHYTILEELTLGSENATPLVGPLVISEIMYNPGLEGFEYIRIENITDEEIPLYDPDYPQNSWKVSGLNFDFPAALSIAPKASLIVAMGVENELDFRLHYKINSSVPLVISKGQLSNGGETLTLKKPEEPFVDSSSMKEVVPYMDVDKVKYSDNAPWPTDADGIGFALKRVEIESYGNDAANWVAALPGFPDMASSQDSISVSAAVFQTDMLPAILNLYMEAESQVDSIDARIKNEDNSETIIFSPIKNSKTRFSAQVLDLAPGNYSLQILARDSDGKQGIVVKSFARKP